MAQNNACLPGNTQAEASHVGDFFIYLLLNFLSEKLLTTNVNFSIIIFFPNIKCYNKI